MSSDNKQKTNHQMPQRYHSNNGGTKSTAHGLPNFAHNSRRQIGLSDPGMLEYIKQSNNHYN